MNVVTEKNFAEALPLSARREFWRRVEWALAEVFNVPASAAREYQRRVSDSSIAEQILAYHHDPLLIAADLAGIESLNGSQIQKYSIEMARRDAELAARRIPAKAKEGWLAELFGTTQPQESPRTMTVRHAVSFGATGVAIVSAASKIAAAQDLVILNGVFWSLVFGGIGALCAVYFPWINRQAESRTQESGK
jgi:hypothetical protein